MAATTEVSRVCRAIVARLEPYDRLLATLADALSHQHQHLSAEAVYEVVDALRHFLFDCIENELVEGEPRDTPLPVRAIGVIFGFLSARAWCLAEACAHDTKRVETVRVAIEHMCSRIFVESLTFPGEYDAWHAAVDQLRQRMLDQVPAFLLQLMFCGTSEDGAIWDQLGLRDGRLPSLAAADLVELYIDSSLYEWCLETFVCAQLFGGDEHCFAAGIVDVIARVASARSSPEYPPP